MKYILILFLGSIFCFSEINGQIQATILPCYYTNKKVNIDGKLDDKIWQTIPWSSEFVDIRGIDFPKPVHTTQFKVCWNKKHLFIAAKINDPHIWATMCQNESPLYEEDAFEIFIDPENDGFDYFELEINPLGTTWDLQMDKPYNDGGVANSNWNIDGLKTSIQINGTIDNPTDKDEGWVLEIAIPITNFFEGKKPRKKELINQIWAINFLRTDWDLDIENQQYFKPKNTEKAARFWVWQPHEIINMHIPERWGKIQFVK